ncbi:MAG: LuxR C-terminal-related transcriptional regulator [Bacteroidales bacterium]|nr:LuxR C-terminal-related transcriptional regulator [Bacteroidales bacterium]
MLEYLSWTIFVISVGLTAFGIMLSIQLRKEYSNPAISALLYYQVFAFAFGLYSIWGQAILNLYIDDLLKPELRDKISTLATLQGFPFMILAWYMLIRFTRRLTERKPRTLFSIVYVILTGFAFGSLIWYVTRPENDPTIFYYYFYSIIAFISQIIASLNLFFLAPENKRISRKKLSIISLFIACITLGQLLILNLSSMTGYYTLGFVLLFFIQHAGVPVLVRYQKILKPLLIKKGFKGSFESFCALHDISPRESDIIREICKGLTNKEISEALFISLQTVKDHTHRIYIKTGARNRVELINRLKEVL